MGAGELSPSSPSASECGAARGRVSSLLFLKATCCEDLRRREEEEEVITVRNDSVLDNLISAETLSSVGGGLMVRFVF